MGAVDSEGPTTARGRGTTFGRARKARRPQRQEEASRKIKKGGEHDKKGAKSKGEEGKGDDKGEEKEGAGRHPTKERRKADKKPAEVTSERRP